ncbi:MAG: aldo/keto reductase [Proteobacteria bacterium]|nr:aldo/keto reductase [Pseudomonadota bacterium]
MSENQRRLGKTGLYVSEVGLGCNNFGVRMDELATERVVHAALDQGITLFDTADVYGEQRSEVYLGKALQGRRDQAIVATKFGSPVGPGNLNRGGSRRYVRAAIEASLARLNTDYIDLYQIHFPDAATPVDETLGVLDDLVREGKVRYIGHSNFTGWQIADADWQAKSSGVQRFVTAQNHLSLLERDALKEVIPACDRFSIGLLPYFPLASGMLTGKYHRGEAPEQGTRMAQVERIARRSLTDANFDLVDRLTAYAQSQGRSLLDLAFGWLLSFPSVSSVIAGATSPAQIEANLNAASWRLSEEQMAEVKSVVNG